MALAKALLPACMLSLLNLSALADGVVDVNVFTNELQAEIEFASGVAVDLTVTFEQVSGLDISSIGVSAELIDPLDPALLARLPDSLISPLSAFPLLLTIEPPPDGTLSFQGVAEVSLHTHNLGYSVASPFRLFVADDGGSFADITDSAGSGSYRVRGSQGEFCEFMIVADLRDIGEVVIEKFDRLESLLAHNQSLIGASLYSTLTADIAAVRKAYDADDLVEAIETLDDFVLSVRENAGGAIPNLWRAREDIVNVDGELRAAAATLRYSLTLVANDLP